MNITKETTEAQDTPVEQITVTPGDAILLAITAAADLAADCQRLEKTVTEDEHNAIQYQVGTLRRLVDEMHE